MAAFHARRALALVGTRFRAQGRDPTVGIDCIGLCLLAYDLPIGSVRSDYRLRGDHRREFEQAIGLRFARLRRGTGKPGDLLLMLPAADQIHLGILTARGFVHADARWCRVVECPGTPTWPIVGLFRLRRKKSR